MLGAFDIKYLPRTAIKGQVLVNLVAEIIEGTEETVIKKREVSSLDVLVISTPCPHHGRFMLTGQLIIKDLVSGSF